MRFITKFIIIIIIILPNTNALDLPKLKAFAVDKIAVSEK